MAKHDIIHDLVEEAIREHLELCLDDYIGDVLSPEVINRIKKDALAALHSVIPSSEIEIEIDIKPLSNGSIHIDINYNEQHTAIYEPIEDDLDWFVNGI